ncbi:hypothetical protein [Sandaracinus amylolyticus]|uniref:hypothetical protein n=1 Tax=Sandaracinus amylolyticus TaxID=927083 RepID=UPI001F2AA0B5|nr:hypothetical protein [Sandaracinus amylolyticus]UJR82791.1 Hypothetical protein I5071_48560 [Sandaracinus amylolyticus]
MQLLVAVALAVVACAVLYVLARPPRPRARSVVELRDQLRRMTHDAEVAERLVDRMRRRHPDASERTVLRLAIAELRADRRR